MTVSRRDLLQRGPRRTRRLGHLARAGLGASHRSELQARAGRVLARLALGTFRQRTMSLPGAHQEVHRGDRRRGARRQGELGGHPPEGRRGRQCRLGARHHARLVRRRSSISRQAARRHRHRQSPAEIRRLGLEGVCQARRQVHRPADRRHRQRHPLPREHAAAGRLLRIPEEERCVPRDVQGPQGQSKPGGFALGKAVGDGNNFAHWIVWSHGGQMVDANDKVVINSPETIKALQYARELYQTLFPAPRAGSTSTTTASSWPANHGTTNGVSLYYSAKNDPKMADIAKDIRSAILPVGPVGQPIELHQTILAHATPSSRMRPKPHAVHARKPTDRQLDPGLGPICPHCLGLDRQSGVERRSRAPSYRDVAEALADGCRPARRVRSATAIADYVMVDMFAEVASGREGRRAP